MRIEDAAPPAAAPSRWSRHAGLLNIAARLGGAALAFLLNILMARSMAPEGFAQVNVLLAWLALATALASLSMPMVVVRYVGEYLALGRPDMARGVVWFAVATGFAASLAVSVAAWVALHAGWLALTPQALELADLALWLLVPNVMLSVVAGVLHAMNLAVLAEAMSSLLRTTLMLAGVAWLWQAHGQVQGQAWLSPVTLMWLYLAVAVFLLVPCGLMAWRIQAGRIRARVGDCAPRIWLHAAAGLLAVQVAVTANERVDMLMLGWNAPQTETAVYAVAQRFSQTLLMAVTAVAAVLAPRFVGHLPELRAGRPGPAQAAIRATGRLATWTCVAAWLAFALAGPWLATLFGAGYAPAYLPLMILVTGQLLACLFGPALLVASLSGNVRFALLSLGMGTTLNAALNWFTVPHLGAVGAALATAAGTMVSAGVAHACMQRQLGIGTSVFARPAVSTAAGA